MGGNLHYAEPDECFMSIAQQAGFFWETLWKHSTNTELRDKRKNPCVLLEGDAVNIPEKRPGEASGATGKRHRFRRKGIPAKLRLQFCEDGKPVKSAPWRADVDGRLHHGETDADGTAELPIPGHFKPSIPLELADSPLRGRTHLSIHRASRKP